MQLWKTNPFRNIPLTHGTGCRVWDSTGKSYLDLQSGTWCNILGYSHPRWVEAVQHQAAQLTHTTWSVITQEVYDALDKLTEILPPALNRAVFLNTGSEAVELALKIARATTGADGIVVIGGNYYGATTYALSLSEAGRSLSYLPKCGTVYRMPVPNCRKCPMGCTGAADCNFSCLSSLEELAGDNSKKIAAVMYEPVLGGGIIVPPAGYGARLQELASQCHALLISEEVTTGMGRTGCWFGFQHDGIVPDLLVIGKAIGGGLPIAAVAATEETELRCQDRLGRHVQSHQNDPFSGRIAATVISVIQDEHLVEQAAQQGSYLFSGLKNLQQSLPYIADVRGKGAMLGVELHNQWAGKGTEIAQHMLDAGFIMDYHLSTSTFRFFPPFVISKNEIDEFLTAFQQILQELEQ